MVRVRAGREGGDNTKVRSACAHALHSRRMDTRHKLSGRQTQDSGRVVASWVQVRSTEFFLTSFSNAMKGNA